MRTMKKKWQKVLTSFASLIFFDIQITELLLCWLRSLLKSLISFVPENLHLFHAESWVEGWRAYSPSHRVLDYV